MYTLKLDLSEYEHAALVTVLRAEIDRAERDGTPDSPFCTAVSKILDDIHGYDRAVAEYVRGLGS
jgi:hypothetical protein